MVVSHAGRNSLVGSSQMIVATQTRQFEACCESSQINCGGISGIVAVCLTLTEDVRHHRIQRLERSFYIHLPISSRLHVFGGTQRPRKDK